MSEERDYEAEAIKDGWNPNYDGPNKKDAKTFVEDGEKISGMLKSKIGHLEDRIESMNGTFAEFQQYTDAQRAKDRKENERLIAELEKVRAQAITDGDGNAAVQAERDIRELETPPQQELSPAQAEYNIMAEKWATDSEWYNKNKKLTGYADGIAEKIAASGYTGKAYFKEIDRQVKEVFPEEFENPKRNGAQSVETGGNKQVADSKAHTWANLPDDAKAAAKRFEKSIPGFDRKAYVADYEWE